MCLIIAVFSIIYALVAFNAGNYAAGSVAIVIALFFTLLLIKNVTDVKKMREERKKEQSEDMN